MLSHIHTKTNTHTHQHKHAHKHRHTQTQTYTNTHTLAHTLHLTKLFFPNKARFLVESLNTFALFENQVSISNAF